VAKVAKNAWDLVVGGTHERDPPGVGGKRLPRLLDRLGVPVHPDKDQFGVRIKQRTRNWSLSGWTGTPRRSRSRGRRLPPTPGGSRSCVPPTTRSHAFFATLAT